MNEVAGRSPWTVVSSTTADGTSAQIVADIPSRYTELRVVIRGGGTHFTYIMLTTNDVTTGYMGFTRSSTTGSTRWITSM